MKSDIVKRSDGLMSFDDYDQNNDRFMYWSGIWPNDGTTTFSQYEAVWWEGAVWVCRAGVTATLEQPTSTATDWQVLTPSAGRGAMTIDSAKISLGTIGAGWEPIDEFDSIDLNAIGVSLTPATGLFSFSYPGIWQVALTLIFEHNESNQGRSTRLRLWNDTQSVEVGNVPYFIGRNQPGTNVYIAFPIVVQEANIGDNFRFEIGGGDSITVVIVEGQAIDLFQFGTNYEPSV